MTEAGFHKVCVVGAGVIGGWLGARLAGAGCELSVRARGAALAALRGQGLRLRAGAQALTAMNGVPWWFFQGFGGARIGLAIAQQAEDRHAVRRQLGAFETSMLQHVEAGRVVELDALVTVVKELGELTGVDTPFTVALLGLARLHARGRGLY